MSKELINDLISSRTAERRAKLNTIPQPEIVFMGSEGVVQGLEELFNRRDVYEVIDRSLTKGFKVFSGERFLRVLPNSIPEYMAVYSADRVSKENMATMRREQAKIWALGEDEEKVRALVEDQERFMAMMMDQTPKEQELKIKYKELTEEQRQERAKRLLRVEGFRSQGRIMRDFSENCTSWVALQMLYDLGELGVERLREKYKALGQDISEEEIERERRVARMWFGNFDNAAAVRERGVVNKLNIIEAAREARRHNSYRPVNVGSIACGSSFVVLEAIEQLMDEGIPVIGYMVDINEKALDYTQKRAQEMYLEERANKLGVTDVIRVMKGNVVKLGGEFIKQKFDVLEAAGIMDYFDDRLALLFLRQLPNLLEPGGTLIASCIMDNSERDFLYGAVGWADMVYRTPEGFAYLFINPRVGFLVANCKSIRTSNGLYTMVVVRTPITEEKMAA